MTCRELMKLVLALLLLGLLPAQVPAATTQIIAAQDNYIKLKKDDENYGASTTLLVDRETTDLHRALLQFDLSSIPAGSTINSATLKMEATSGADMNIAVYEVLQAWDEGSGNGDPGEANWNDRMFNTAWDTAGGSFNATAVDTINGVNDGQHTWDVTTLVRAWLGSGTCVGPIPNPSPNYGLMVASPDGGGNRVAEYDSREGTTPPFLDIDYSPPLSSIADLGVTKTVDVPAPLENNTIDYTVTVSNTGPDTVTLVEISDVLPAGVTFVSDTPSQGTYDNVTGAWDVGTIGAGSNATLTIQASVDFGTAGTTITNTASVASLSGTDPNACNDSDSVDIDPAGNANLLVLKSSSVVRDSLGATAPNALAIPGATVQFEVSTTNSGSAVATDVIVTDMLDTNLTFLAGEYNGGTSDVQITVGVAAPVYCIAEVGGDSNADGCFLNGAGDFLTVSIPISGSYPTGLTLGTVAPNNVAVVRFSVTVN